MKPSFIILHLVTPNHGEMMSVARLLLYLLAYSLLVDAFHIPRLATTLNRLTGSGAHLPNRKSIHHLTRLKAHDHINANLPSKRYAEVDYTVLEPDDPRFVNMPIPSENGPLAEAYNKHMLWRRGLSTNERSRWHNWAVYRSMNENHQADYSLQDYISQNLLHELNNQAKEERRDNNTVQAFVMSSMGVALEAAQREEVREIMRSYYDAFNNQILGQVRNLWQQDVDVECILPGHAKARGDRAVDTLYMSLFDSTTSMGWINATISSVQAYGNVALVYTVEEVGERLMSQTSSISYVTKKPTPLAPGMTLPRVLATTVLRRCNSQWRIVSHHAVRMWSSPFTNDQIDVTFSKQDARRRTARMNPHLIQTNKDAGPEQHSEGQSGDSRMPQEALQKLIAEVAESVLSVTPNSSASDTSSSSLPVQSALFSDLATSAEPSLETHNQSIKSIKEQAKSTDVPANKAGEIIDAVIVEDSKQKSERTVQTGDSDRKIDSYAPLNKQFVQALRLLHQQGRITRDEKETLLADILSSVKQDKDSIVETAYEKLCGPADEVDLELHLTDFASECRTLLKVLEEESVKST